MKKMNLIWLMLFSLSLAACGNQEDISSAATDESAEQASEQPVAVSEAETIPSLLSAIRQQVGNPVASTVEECRVVGLGQRPCGGPERFLVYSTATTDEEQLMGLVERYNALAREQVSRSGMVGTCEVLPEPGLILRGGVCVAAEKALM
ncbi:hypothetical protein CWE08_01115 [Aliidiomarina iranensis]|uniref:Uncharacterized protein n=1 Tax=Aliidiomarina iranensis TaxID=1434071 RepID=A0A432W228_9GAMM|nr:hypothetical protein [Aliidiomarina iranensis]RUO23282.1 hypothetical protein CWE08_01115 [Aliidiomarina iranensis]